ncbi:hypothetical protein BX600DRAFT_437096 [Xylariales sp. PMI_506]|nr:hypothetical protein BX600DRAFT_437096 [Xylariales sp. PMI_506]
MNNTHQTVLAKIWLSDCFTDNLDAQLQVGSGFGAVLGHMKYMKQIEEKATDLLAGYKHVRRYAEVYIFKQELEVYVANTGISAFIQEIFRLMHKLLTRISRSHCVFMAVEGKGTELVDMLTNSQGGKHTKKVTSNEQIKRGANMSRGSNNEWKDNNANLVAMLTHV